MEIIEVLPQLHILRVPAVNDLNIYLWHDGTTVTVIDAGIPGMAADIAAGLDRLGFAPEHVRHVVVTHAHPDHVGSLADIAHWGAEVLVHHADAEVVRGNTPLPPARLRDWERSIIEALPPAPAAAPSRVDRELRDGDTVEFGGGARILAMPGHTAGSIAIHLPQHRVLFTGDTVANVGGHTTAGVFNIDSDAVESQARRIAEMDVDVVCVGHGDVLRGPALLAWQRS